MSPSTDDPTKNPAEPPIETKKEFSKKLVFKLEICVSKAYRKNPSKWKWLRVEIELADTFAWPLSRQCCREVPLYLSDAGIVQRRHLNRRSSASSCSWLFVRLHCALLEIRGTIPVCQGSKSSIVDRNKLALVRSLGLGRRTECIRSISWPGWVDIQRDTSFLSKNRNASGLTRCWSGNFAGKWKFLSGIVQL